MALTLEQIQELKEQLREQVKNLPNDKKNDALSQIESLSSDALESMLKEQQKKPQSDKSVFRMIIDLDIESVSIDENKSALAVLDIAPISKGHIIIIPKKPVSDANKMPTSAFSLAKKIAKTLTKKLEARGTQIQTESKFGENIINIIPFYSTPLNINSPRTKASTQELNDIASIIRPKKKVKIEKIKIKKTESSLDPLLKLPRRIP